MQSSRLIAPALLLAGLFGADRASAQPAGSRVEVGAHAAILRLNDFNGAGSTTNGGLGGRVSFDLTSWMAVEAEVNFFPSDKSRVAPFVDYRRRTDALVGIKVGARGERMGVFLKARPGITYVAYQHGGCDGDCSLALPPPPPPAGERSWTDLAFDVGGGVEFYPGGRGIARAEIGDTIFRDHNEVPPWQWPPRSRTSHNLSFRFGVGFRF